MIHAPEGLTVPPNPLRLIRHRAAEPEGDGPDALQRCSRCGDVLFSLVRGPFPPGAWPVEGSEVLRAQETLVAGVEVQDCKP